MLHSIRKCSKIGRFIHNDTTLFIYQSKRLKFHHSTKSKIYGKFNWQYEEDDSKLTAEAAIFGYIFLPSLFQFVIQIQIINSAQFHTSSLHKHNCFDYLSVLNGPGFVMSECVTVLVTTSDMITHHFKKLCHPARSASYSYSGWNVETVYEKFHSKLT